MASNNEGNIKKIMVNLDALQTKSPKKTTRKNPPNIEPNRLKDTFMKQVQHYKSLANTKKQKQETTPSKPLSAYTDEFNASVEYLNNIKKSVNLIQTELPTELIDDIPIAQMPKPMLVHEPITPTLTNSTSIKYKVDNEIPYGCLKNGIKQTLKNMTRNNRPRQTDAPRLAHSLVSFNSSPTFSSTVAPSNVVPSSNMVPSSVVPSSVVPSHVVPSHVVPSHVVPSSVVPLKSAVPTFPTVTSSSNMPPSSSSVVPLKSSSSNATPSLPFEKTIIKRHVIGKSKKSRHVGVLIKNASTRKMITDEYKKLKKINISEVKTQLKNNGLLKVGSTAPADILRQTYESSILAGLVKNDSEGTTYHNFINEENNK